MVRDSAPGRCASMVTMLCADSRCPEHCLLSALRLRRYVQLSAASAAAAASTTYTAPLIPAGAALQVIQP